MDSALAALNSSRLPNIAEVARTYGVNRSTLSRRWRNKTAAVSRCQEINQLLTVAQEDRLVLYIGQLCDRGLPPTPAVVRNIALNWSNRVPGINWCSRFVQRHTATLDSRFLNALDLARFKADSEESYKHWFSLVQEKIEGLSITANNIYNMDEKGFRIGCVNRTRRIFTKASLISSRLLGASHDGNREWITIVGTICADGTEVMPLIIYSGKDLQESWLEGYTDGVEAAFTTSDNGWTSNSLGIDWLCNVFIKHTAAKARRSWRCLFLDSHGSHLTSEFIDMAYNNRILLAFYPPHSTHRLQPLDVGVFAPLSTFYSQGLDKLMQRSHGRSIINKDIFFTVFWPAYKKACTTANVSSAWEKAGLWPFNPRKVLNAFSKPATAQKRASDEAQLYSPAQSKRLRTVINQTASQDDVEVYKRVLTQLGDSLLQVSADLVVSQYTEAQALSLATTMQPKKTRRKQPIEQLRAEASGTVIFTPRKMQRYKDILAEKEHEEEVYQQQKEARKAERLQHKADQQAQVQARRAQRAIAKDQQQQIAAQRKAELQKAREVKAALRAAKEAATTSQRPPTPPIPLTRLVPKRKSVKVVAPVPEVIPTTVTRSGRSVGRPARLLD